MTPAAAALQAPPGWRAIDFLSDVHLHPQHPRTAAAWAAHLAHTDADAVFMLGDLFEVWVGDDARQGRFEAACLAACRAAGRPLYFMAGNRDFLLGPAALAAAGLTALADPTVLHFQGQAMLLTHGDALCLADTAYMHFRAQVRGPAWQAQFLARPLAERQALARQMRDASSAHQAGKAWADVDADEAARWLAAAGCTTMLHGHTHRPGVHALPGGGTRHVLGDWDLDATPPRHGVLRWSAAGLRPQPLASGAC